MTNLTSWLGSPDALTAIQAEQARRSLLNFTKFTFPAYQADPAHQLLAGTLERVVAGEIDRLMIFMPPQHGKSELVSVRLPAYWLAKRPDDPVLLASYGADLAHGFSRLARDLVESDAYRAVFPSIQTNRASRAGHHWKLARPRRGFMKAAGVGGPITGHGAGLGIIDDPYEGWLQAQSETIRRNVEAWYRGTFRTRIWEGGAIILMMTRWHEADLAGYLLEKEPDRWVVLRLPALSEGAGDPLGRPEGAPLCPSRFSLAALLDIQESVGEMVWTAEYQGRPTHETGDVFKVDWIKRYDPISPPAMGYTVQSWDTAYKETEAAAYSALTTWGHARQGAVLLNAWRERLTWPDLALAIGLHYVVARPRPRMVLIEDAASGQSAVQQWQRGRDREELVKQCREYLERSDAKPTMLRLIEAFLDLLSQVPETVHVPVVGVPVEGGDKVMRAKSASVWWSAGQVWHPTGAPWLEAFEAELLSFPRGKYADWVDSAGQAVLKLLGPVGAGTMDVQDL